jgi:hypothetical protein
MRISKINAILSLHPGAEVVVRGEEVEWIKPSTAPVTEAQIAAELVRLQADYEAKQYQRDRASEYPAIGDQLDALWKGGSAAEEMLALVQAVKDKYPKA